MGPLLLLMFSMVHSPAVPVAVPVRAHAISRVRVLAAATTDTDVAGKTSTRSLMPRERYVATNQFSVRPGAEAKFEARWANRKSRLAELDGFRYFQLMRRVKLDDAQPDYDDDFGCVSFTIWETKDDFDAWRKGDAFKEAHGGTSIGAFLSAMLSSLRVLKGPPRPVFYDGILHLSTKPDSVPETQGGWRVVEADGVNQLPTEAFVACNRFSVLPGMESAFEERWAQRDSQLKDLPGFVSFTMLRRDFGNKGHGGDNNGPEDAPWNYMSTTVWKDRASFDNWRSSQQFKNAHGQKQGPGGDAGVEGAPKPPPMWAGPPKPVFYEAVLVLSSPEGA